MMDPHYNTIERQIVRIMFILYFCHSGKEQAMQLSMFEQDTKYFIDSETRLQKLDFWVRYPDHLSAALLHGCETNVYSGPEAQQIKQIIRQIFQDEEPALRRIPMHKYLRGAFEPLDDVLSFLSSRNLAYRRRTGQSRQRTRYILTKKGVLVVDKLLAHVPETTWYANRCKLIQRYFGHLKGYEIRELQYLERKYADALYSELIEGVEDEVRARFERFFGEKL